ncbi:MAG: hypothetical protein ACD_3C00136G0004 [uncultured bacterium (gcode 4)]|uniref:Uncharacterized protein n=1 Tax=uncultured bacterium (gcode 4) TaxID=1234023 RepID=K2FY19_9BACT|nr:MAG: hypothetical protein ACD_3C00136G0004 [uncultured bacterium (gcode 4)]
MSILNIERPILIMNWKDDPATKKSSSKFKLRFFIVKELDSYESFCSDSSLDGKFFWRHIIYYDFCVCAWIIIFW